MKTILTINLTFEVDNDFYSHEFVTKLKHALLKDQAFHAKYGLPVVGQQVCVELNDREEREVSHDRATQAVILNAKQLATDWYYARAAYRDNGGPELPFFSTRQVAELMTNSLWEIHKAALDAMTAKIREYAEGELDDGVTKTDAVETDFDAWFEPRTF